MPGDAALARSRLSTSVIPSCRDAWWEWAQLDLNQRVGAENPDTASDQRDRSQPADVALTVSSPAA